MRWENKPRKKTSKEIVLEYIKFMKTMGYFHILTKVMYNMGKLHGNYVPLYKYHLVKIYPVENLIHKQNMIRYFQASLVNTSTFRKYDCERIFVYGVISPYLSIRERIDIIELLWSYFKDKHIANCTIVGDTY